MVKDENNKEIKTVKEHQNTVYFFGEFETPIKLKALTKFVVAQLIALYGLYTYNWTDWKMSLFFLASICLSSFGTSGGAHRYFSHGAFKAKKPLKFILLCLVSFQLQSRLTSWVRDHRAHHKYTDTIADPHNTNRGFFYSHCGWFILKRRPEAKEILRKIDISDVAGDPMVQFFEKYHTLLGILIGVILPITVTKYLFDISWFASFCYNTARYQIALHMVLSINSFAHFFGDKPFNIRSTARNNYIFQYLGIGLGEGWHNYHHAFPWDYRASELGVLSSFTTIMIYLFSKIGWAYDLRTTTPEMIDKTAQKTGDGTYLRTISKLTN